MCCAIHTHNSAFPKKKKKERKLGSNFHRRLVFMKPSLNTIAKGDNRKI